jgi:hypothetical protein
MPSEFDPKLESLVHEHLRQLPPLSAPATLAPRVLAALRARAERPWWQRDWWQWPFSAKLVFTALALAAVAAFTGSGWFVDTTLEAYSQQTAPHLNTVWSSFLPVMDAGLLLWEKLFQSVALYGLILLAFLYTSCLGAGTLLVRLAVKNS